MHTSNEIAIEGDPLRVRDRVFELAADLESWPVILPHYRYMRVRERSDRHKVADFGASRDGLPVSWRARQELFPDEYRVTFRHIAGATRGMWVEWHIEPLEGMVRVRIDHDLDYPVPVLGALFARYIVCGLFVENIAGKTLRCIKALIEAENMRPST